MATGITPGHGAALGPEHPAAAAPTWGPGWGALGPTDDELHREQVWEKLVGQGLRPEIVGGRIYVSPRAKMRHCVLVDRLSDQLYDVKRKNGWEFYQTWAVHIPPHRGDKRLPDLLITPPDSPEFDDNQAYGYGTLMAVEVVSSDSRDDDLDVKPAEYARAGVPMMLVLDDFSTPPSVRLLYGLAEGEYRASIVVNAGLPLLLPEPFEVTLDTNLIFR
ncbi:Uma2 family endonuclease [Nonomuraea sp. NEAU-A123]|uniref:Uma2 family endonuclease n=1 Tax=Nonomuraea sp. NEAU-A123 TaxID=2839649 RepID=UPI001BE4545D|nr:Uma2 family endonuclease [Nonomuraea sp. NEAU-A123]MBT2230560.1 Uma2 family endonuclease [Nonomuraea sp. NEAU-A123]